MDNSSWGIIKGWVAAHHYCNSVKLHTTVEQAVTTNKSQMF